jgi:hypothetical protein
MRLSLDHIFTSPRPSLDANAPGTSAPAEVCELLADETSTIHDSLAGIREA